jgi:cytochrome P450
LPQNLLEFDPFSETFFDDPYEVYADLRDNAPLYFNEQYEFYALSRYHDVVAAHGDTDRLRSSYGVTLDMLMAKQQVDLNMLILMDPPRHTQQRQLVSQVFKRRNVANLEPLVTQTVIDFVDDLDGRNSFDLVADFAALFPVEVISAMLGVPKADRQLVRHRIDVSLARRPGNPGPTEEGIVASLETAEYFLELIKAKRKHPDDLIISKLIDAVIVDDDGTERRLTDDEVASFSLLIGAAGSETVTKLIGNGAVLFDQHRDQWRQVLEDESRIPAAVEEILRFHPPSQYQGRFAVEDIELAAGTIPGNSPVLLLTGAATRDPRAYDKPDVFDIARGGGFTTLAFGYGSHSCLGAWLARLESRVAFMEIRRRWPNYSVDHDGLKRVNMVNVAGYSNVPVSAR